MNKDEPIIDRLGEVAKLFDKQITVRLGEHHFTEPKEIKCPRCGSLDIWKYGKNKEGIQEYLCEKCHRKFSDRDLPFGMRTPIDQIGTSLSMYYTGSSLSDIAGFLKTTHNNPVQRSTVYDWLMKYTQEAINLFEPIHPKVGDVWIADETVIKFNDVNHWVFDGGPDCAPCSTDCLPIG